MLLPVHLLLPMHYDSAERPWEMLKSTVATSKFQRKHKQRASNPKVSRSFDLFHASAQCTKTQLSRRLFFDTLALLQNQMFSREWTVLNFFLLLSSCSEKDSYVDCARELNRNTVCGLTFNKSFIMFHDVLQRRRRDTFRQLQTTMTWDSETVIQRGSHRITETFLYSEIVYLK